MRLPGCATPEGTERYRTRFTHLASDHFREALGLTVSSVGLGTYLGDPDPATDSGYAASIESAIEAGCNVIDTAVNYRYQASERVIGRTLKGLLDRGSVARDELVICTKGGYLAFDGPPQDPRGWVEETFIKPGIITWGDIVEYNVMAPAYLRHQIQTSRENLGLDTLDLYYLHNPESQLQGISRSELLERLGACFEELEHQVEQGAVGAYGTATWNGYRVDPRSQGYLSLEELVSLAQSVGGQHHHFKVVQLPFNLGMTEAFTLENQDVAGDRVTLLAAAARLGVTVVASGSLMQGRLAQLPAGFTVQVPGASTDAQRALQFVRSTPGVTTALVGMKTPAHVEQNLHIASVPAMTAEMYSALYR
jgi:aryl-alcohol dehydrogenase-like predicted oxidoreductase